MVGGVEPINNLALQLREGSKWPPKLGEVLQVCWRRSMRRLVALTVGLIVILMSPPVFSESFTDKAKNDSTVEVSDEDPAMQRPWRVRVPAWTGF